MFKEQRTISENKQERLMDIISQLENEVSDFYHSMEDEQSIQDDTFKQIDKRTEVFFRLLNELREEVVFV